MEQIVMYCIDGHERKPKGLILTRLKDIELASIIEQQYEKIFLYVETCMNDLSSAGVTLKFCCPRNLIKLGSEKFPCRSHGAGDRARISHSRYSKIYLYPSGPRQSENEFIYRIFPKRCLKILLNQILISSK